MLKWLMVYCCPLKTAKSPITSVCILRKELTMFTLTCHQTVKVTHPEDRISYRVVSHNHHCFQCNIAITNFLVSHTCDIRFHDVISQSTNDVKAKFLKHGFFFFFNLIRWIQLCDEKNLTFVDC